MVKGENSKRLVTFKTFAAAAVFGCGIAVGACGADIEAQRVREEGRTLSHWHAGPFFEYRRSQQDATYWSIRPFYSQAWDSQTNAVVRDILWPLGTYHYHHDASWYRALIAYGDTRDADPSWSFNVFPFWFSGTDRFGADYWGLFPFYGEHPHFLFMDDWNFVLWPIWQTYSVKNVRSHGVLWPFVTWRDEPRTGVGVWPFYGVARQRESTHSYCLWPFATWASYDEDRDTSGSGSSWMLWPLFGQIRRARESQTLVLPPFFSYAKTDSATRWRLPWPFIDLTWSSVRDRVSVWPFYESIDGYSYDRARNPQPEERTRRYGWYLVEDVELTSSVSHETRFTVFPFWTSEHRYAKAKDGALTEVGSYKRLWPFWSSETDKGKNRQRALELMPVRHVEGVERNWAPFWTFWECWDRPDGRTRHSLFWHLVTWHTSPSL